MARPLLDTSALRTPIESRESGWARGLSQAASGIARGIEKRAQWKEKEQQEFISAMTQDIDAVSNDLFKTYAVDQFEKLRGNWVSTFESQKGKMTPQQKILMQSDLKKYQAEVEYLNSLSQYNSAAQQAQQKQPGLKYKGKDWINFVKAVDSGDTKAVREIGSKFLESDAGVPGTELVPLDINDAFISVAPSVKKLLPKKESGVGVETFKKDGEDWEAGYKNISHGDVTDLDNLVYTQLNKSGRVKNTDKSLRAIMTPEEQKSAILEFGDGDGAFTKWALREKVPLDVKDEFVAPTKEYESINRIPEGARGSGRGGAGWTNIKETDIGWEFGTTPIAISKSIGGETYKNASVVSVKKDDQGEYMAEMVVPKGKNESLQKIIKQRSSDEGRDLTNQETAMIVEELLSDERYKTVSVPLKNVYKELQAGFDKKKLNLQGYRKIAFPKEGKSTKTKTSFIGVPEGGF